jgi:carbamoyl-phosphate synthase small subunit
MTGFLVLEDGTTFRGESVGADAYALGEAVFTTAMTGYQEVVTDPSYAEQLVCFTAPMVGNYGVAPPRNESRAVHAKAVIMREARGPAWTDWLAERGLPALSGIDTRTLVQRLREEGSMRAAVVAGDGSVEEALRAVRELRPMEGRALAGSVSTREPYAHGPERGARIAVLDYGCKRSILTRLAAAGAQALVYPHDTPAQALLETAPDGVLLSNGPGDPAALQDEIEEVRRLLGRIPLLGICLGHQLLALATGHETFKLRFGHRGANHPVLERATGRVLVTSQNHGFAVRPTAAEEAAYVSLYDGTVEGLEYPEYRARSLQFHPEAGPGPHDARPLLESWVQEVALAQAA